MLLELTRLKFPCVFITSDDVVIYEDAILEDATEHPDRDNANTLAFEICIVPRVPDAINEPDENH